MKYMVLCILHWRRPRPLLYRGGLATGTLQLGSLRRGPSTKQGARLQKRLNVGLVQHCRRFFKKRACKHARDI